MSRAEDVAAPFDAVTQNEFGVIKALSGTSHAAQEIPESWCGRYVDLYCDGGNVHFAFSTHIDSEVDSSVAAASPGATTKVGGVIADGLANRVPKIVPNVTPGTKMYLIHESDAADTDLYIELSSH